MDPDRWLTCGIQVWKEIDLELKAKHLPLFPGGSQDEDEKTETSYFLCHPDLSSETIVPPPVTCVKFKGLVCKINLRIDTSWRAGGRRRPSTKANKEPIQVEPELPVAEESGPGKRRNPRWITRAANVKYADTSRQPARKARLDTQPDSTNSESDAVILLSISKEEQKEMALFLDVALRKLIGVKHTSPGVKITEDTQFPSLIEIAPAVWNIRYLQVCKVVHGSKYRNLDMWADTCV